MPIKPAKFVTVGLAGLGLAALFCGFAYITNSTTGLPLKWPPGLIPMRIMVDDVTLLSDGLTRAKSIQAAMVNSTRGWNPNLGNAQLSPTIVPVGSGGADDNHQNEIFYSDAPYSMAWETNTLAVTTAWYSSNQRIEADIIFNNSYTWDSYRGARRGSVVDIQRVALHELGHVLGLDHPDEAGQTVAAVMNSHVSDLDSLASDDITGAQRLYGPPGIPANNNFAAAVTINFSGTSTTVTGFNTNAYKEVGEPNHAGNSGGRSVWWKWTAPGPGSVSITTAGSVFDTTLGIYTGTTVAGLTAAATDTTLDDVQPGVVQSSVGTFTAIGGTTYSIAVDGFNNSDGRGADSGAITLNVSFTAFGTSTTTSTTASSTAPSTSSTTTSIATTTIPPTGGGSTTASSTAPSTSITTTSILPTGGGPSGGGGGGGAPSVWFLGALSLLVFARRLRPKAE